MDMDKLLEKNEYKEEFKVYFKLCKNTYEASKADIFETKWQRAKNILRCTCLN